MRMKNEKEIDTDAVTPGFTTVFTVVSRDAAAASVSISFPFSILIFHFSFSFFIAILIFSFLFATDGTLRSFVSLTRPVSSTDPRIWQLPPFSCLTS